MKEVSTLFRLRGLSIYTINYNVFRFYVCFIVQNDA